MVRKEHAAFYKKIYQSKPIGETRSLYPYVNFEVGLYSTNIDEIRENVLTQYPFFRSSEQEKASLFDKKPELALA
jgi:hypothetical protein